jgi:translocation protein SEC63
MQVQPPEAVEEAGAAADDDISEPDEDTIAGQMAAMRGQPVKRIDGDGEGEDEYTTSDSEEDESSDSSSSDSDSD